jgi:hypothetical protein
VGPLIIIADAEGDGVIVTWHQVSDVDGYHVVTPDGDTVSLDYDETSYNDDFPSSTGTYIVFAVRGSINGETSQISTAPYASPAPETLYVFSHPTKPCSFGWDAVTGIGSTSIADFYLNDIAIPFQFTSADESPFNGERTAHIFNTGDTDFFEAPESGYYNSEVVTVGDHYAFNLMGDYYAKVYVTSTTDSTATFRYWFQTIQSLRLF